MQTINRRGGLQGFREAVKGKKVTLGFIGGSITEAANENNWPEFIRGWFVQKFPQKRLYMENAALGGTSSFCGLMRADRDLISQGCDLVFVEYAVNDPMSLSDFHRRTREGLVRKLLKSGTDVVIVYTYCQNMYRAMQKGEVPQSVAEFELLAEHYGVSSVWMGKYAYDAVKSGRISWEGWLPISGGSLHPDYAGSMLYAEPVIALLEEELSKEPVQLLRKGKDVPAPYDPENYENMKEIPESALELDGPWVFMREVFSPWYRRVLYTAADGASLKFRFKGRVLGAMCNFGKRCALFETRIDGGAWTPVTGEREYWVPDKNWTAPILFADGLGEGEHTFEMRIRHGDGENYKGTECKIYAFYSAE